MVYLQSERSTRHNEATYAFAVDIPVPGFGLGSDLERIVRIVEAAGGETWSYSVPPSPQIRIRDWLRCGFNTAADADAFVAAWANLRARRAR